MIQVRHAKIMKKEIKGFEEEFESHRPKGKDDEFERIIRSPKLLISSYEWKRPVQFLSHFYERGPSGYMKFVVDSKLKKKNKNNAQLK